MRPKVYEELIRVLRTDDKNMTKLFNKMDADENNSMMFVVKDYNSQTGLSHKLNNEHDVNYEMKGPLGKRLDVDSTGIYYVFAAGTGILPFMDLIGQLAFANLGIMNLANADKQDRISPHELRLKLYVSFAKRADAYGLDLMFALQNFCKRANILNFDLYLRLSEEGLNAGRWEEGFIRTELRKTPEKDITRIFVSGPPAMNETFDRFFEENKANWLDDSQIQIL